MRWRMVFVSAGAAALMVNTEAAEAVPKPKAQFAYTTPKSKKVPAAHKIKPAYGDGSKPVWQDDIVSICEANWQGFHREICRGWSSSHGVVVDVPAGQRVCVIEKKTEGNPVGDAMSRAQIKVAPDGHQFIDVFSKACASSNPADRRGASIKSRYSLVTIGKTVNNKACDYKELQQIGPDLICDVGDTPVNIKRTPK